MNKVFKVIWNKSKNCYVVVSELAKNNSGKKKIVVAGIFAALAMTNANVAFAVNDVPSGSNTTAVAFGTGASVTGLNAVGLGKDAKANKNNVVVIGTGANAESNESIAIGNGSYSTSSGAALSTASVAVGSKASAQGNTTIAIGTNAKVKNSKQGIAIGGGAADNDGAIVEGDQGIAIGGNTYAKGDASIVIGGDDTDSANSRVVDYTDINNGNTVSASLQAAVQKLTGVNLGNPRWTTATAGHAGVTLGMKAHSGNASIAIGTAADAKTRLAGTSDVTNAVAIGTGAKANRDNSVALGGGSTTDLAGTKQTGYTLPNGVTASWAGGSSTLPGDIVSFGSKGYERQLKNVAPGEVSATSTDAINGSQLAAIADQITYKYVSINSADTPNRDNTGAKATNSIAIGPNASTTAAANKAIAIGDGASATTANGVAIGSQSVASIASGVAGYNANTGRTDTYANLTGATLTSTLGGVAVGTTGQTRQINYVAAGTADTDAVNVAQLKSVNLAFTGDTGSGDVNLANSKLAVNGDNTYITTTANGKSITIAGKKQDISVANGTATATAGMADSANVADAINKAIDQNKYGWNLSANGEATPEAIEKGNTVDFSGDDNITVARNNKNISVSLKKELTGLNSASFNNAAGNPTVKIDGNTGINAGDMKVTNVADGVADKDAVNMSQLKKTDDKAEANKTAIQKNTTALANKISLEGNTGSTTEKSLNDGAVSFKIKGEDGIATTAAGNDVTVKLDTDTKNKIDNAADKDLSNLNPAGEQKVKDLAAWNVVANSETAEKVKGGDTVKFIDGNNIEITQAGKDFTISTKKDVTFDNVTANQAITAPKVKATNGVETPQVTGLTNTDWVPGQTQPVSGRAATEDQLKKVDDQVADNKQKIADNKDAIKKNADDIADNKANITKNAGDIATNKADIAKNKDNIDKNTTAIARKISLGGNSGSTAEKSLSTGDVKFNVKGANGLTTVAAGEDVTVQLDNDTKDKIDNAADKDLSNLNPAGEQKVKDLAAWKVVANSGTAEDVKGGDTVKFINGDNIEITQAGKDFTISTKKDVTFDTVTANQTITAPKVKATNGVETPQVTGLTNTDWVPGQTQPVSGRAATEDQLKAVDDQVAENKANIADNKDKITKNTADIADNKDKITKNTGDIAANKADIAKNKDNIDKNTTAIARKISLGGNTGSTDEKSLSTGDVKFNVKGENGLTTVATGEDVTVKIDDATKAKIDNAADKDLSNLTPAGKQQVKDLAAWNVVANNGTAEKVQGGDTVKFIDGDNVSITQNGKEFTIATKKDVTFDNVTVNQKITAPEVSGLTNTTWVPGQTQAVSGRAATEDQLKAVDDQVTANKQNIADNKTAITKNAGDIATNKADIAKNKDNIDKNTTAIARKISLGGNSGSTDEKSLSTGDVKFNIKGENGLTTVANGEDVTVKLDAATKGKIDNAADQDLSNLTPAGEQQVKDLAAWNVVANGNTAEKVEGGNTVKFINGDNIVITQSGRDFTIATSKDVTFDTVTANQTITAPKVKATTGVETPEVTGLTNKTWVPGQTQPVSGRAATEDQLKAVDDQVAENKANIADNKDKITKNTADIADNKQNIADNKAAITKNAGDIATNKADIAKNKDNIDKNTTAIARKISLGGNTGSTDEKSLSTGDVKFNVKGENGLTTVANGDDVTVKIDDATKDKIDNAADRNLSNLTPAGEQQVKDLAAWNVVANNGTAEKVQGGDTVKFIDGDNISITQNGKDFTVATKKDVTFDNVTVNQKITAPEVSGLTNTTWVPGQTQPVSGRAATEDQLKAVDDQVAANKANIEGNKAAINKNAGDIKTNKDNIAKNTEAIARKISLGGDTGSTDEKSLSTGDVKFNIKGQNGIVTEANGEDVTVKLDDDTANKINNAANTDLSNLTDAGKQQVKDLAAWNVVANNGTAEKVEGGNTVKFIDGDNISITQNGKDFTVATKKDVTFDTVTANQTITAPKVKATDGVETPEVTGLTNKTWVPGQTQPVSGRAATEDQLKQVDDQVAANKDNITKNAGDIATNKANIAANKAQIDKNTEAIGRKISLGGNTGSTDEKSLSTGDVKFNIKGENGLTTVANGEDVTVKIDDATKAKIDNAGNQDLSNLTDAGKQQVKDLSAWNVTAAGGTVEKVQGGDTVKFQAGDNLEVKQDKTTFTYSLAKDVKGLNSVTVGDENGPSTKITPAGTTVKDAAGNSTTVSGAGMTINPANSAASPVSLTVDGLNNGGNQIHGVAPGTADTDAVNLSQLKGTQAGLQEAINRVGVETQRVGAHAAAMAALKPIQYDPLEPTQIMAGIGNYRGETAGAIGLAHYKTEDTMFNVGITLGSSHNMINAGVTHKFGGNRDRKDAVPERYKAGPISSIYVMQDEVSHLRSENEQQKSKLDEQQAKLNQQQSEIDDLKAKLNQLLTKLS